jgi:hypothetical protein
MMRAAARCSVVVVGNQKAFQSAMIRRRRWMVYLVVAGVAVG